MGRYALNIISEYIQNHGLPPTHKEIHDKLHSKGFGKSPNGLDYAIKKLINAGMLKKEGATRNLWPTGKKTPL